MAFYIEHRHRSAGKVTAHQSSPLELAAEEFLNGLLCHYEPPENAQLLQHGRANDDDFYRDQLALRRPPSILKTSNSFDNKKQKKKGRSVRFHGILNNSKSSQRQHGGQRPKFLQRLTCRNKKSSF